MGGKSYKSSTRLEGKLVIITGANTGIGFEVACDMAERGTYSSFLFRCSSLSLLEQF